MFLCENPLEFCSISWYGWSQKNHYCMRKIIPASFCCSSTWTVPVDSGRSVRAVRITLPFQVPEFPWHFVLYAVVLNSILTSPWHHCLHDNRVRPRHRRTTAANGVRTPSEGHSGCQQRWRTLTGRIDLFPWYEKASERTVQQEALELGLHTDFNMSIAKYH